MDRAWRTKAVSDPAKTCSEQEQPQLRDPDLLTEPALVQRLLQIQLCWTCTWDFECSQQEGRGRAHKPGPSCKHTPGVVAGARANLPSVSWAWRAAPALPKAAPDSPPSAASVPPCASTLACSFPRSPGFHSPGVRVRALQQQEVVELQGRSGWKPGEVNDLQELFGCPGFCLLPELLLSFHNLLLYWKFKRSLEGSRNPLTFFLFLGEKWLFTPFHKKE